MKKLGFFSAFFAPVLGVFCFTLVGSGPRLTDLSNAPHLPPAALASLDSIP
jgi:hypothetical protein